RVELPPGVGLPELERCRDAFYPGKKDLRVAVGRWKVGEQISASAESRQEGFLFSSADEKQIYQVSLEGLTVNRLAPYLGWQQLRDEARRLWGLYREVVRPKKVVRVAVRTINRLDLPLPEVELKHYLRTSPEVSPLLPQALSGFFMQLHLPQRDLKATLLLTETAVPPPAPNTTSVVLDLDLFRADDLPSDDGAVWELLEGLRARKNEIFEACITDKTRELIR